MRQGAMPIGRALSIATQTFCTAICNICHWEYQIDFQNIMKRLPTSAMFVGHSTHLNITVFLLSVQTGSLTSWAEGGVVTGWWVRERKHCGNVRSFSICAFVYLYLWLVYLCICAFVDNSCDCVVWERKKALWQCSVSLSQQCRVSARLLILDPFLFSLFVLEFSYLSVQPTPCQPNTPKKTWNWETPILTTLKWFSK